MLTLASPVVRILNPSSTLRYEPIAEESNSALCNAGHPHHLNEMVSSVQLMDAFSLVSSVKNRERKKVCGVGK
jgi:hypothetical protein